MIPKIDEQLAGDLDLVRLQDSLDHYLRQLQDMERKGRLLDNEDFRSYQADLRKQEAAETERLCSSRIELYELGFLQGKINALRVLTDDRYPTTEELAEVRSQCRLYEEAVSDLRARTT